MSNFIKSPYPKAVRVAPVNKECTQACTKIGNNGFPACFARSIQGIERGGKSASEWQKNNVISNLVFIFTQVRLRNLFFAITPLCLRGQLKQGGRQ